MHTRRTMTIPLFAVFLMAGSLSAEPASPTATGVPGLFGISPSHVNNRSAEDAARWVPQMRAIGLRHYRAAGTGWALVEPEQGRWSWSALDQQMTFLEEQGMTFGGLLLGSPSWNALDRPGSLPVHNLRAWSAYVTALVSHAKGRVRDWEVWNEPPNFTGRDQTPADYAKIVISAYEAAKMADPVCRVGLAAKSVHLNYLALALQAGATNHFDYITLHPYEVLNGIADNAGTEAVFLNIVPSVRRMLRAHNPEKADVPILFTELGCDLSRGADVQAHALVKAYALSGAQGVACVHWFEGRDGDSGPLGLLDAQGQPRPAYTAMAQLLKHLGQRPAYLGWLQLLGRHPAFLFQGPETTVLVAWAQKGAPGEVRLGREAEVVNPLTGAASRTDRITLSGAPTLLLDVPEELQASAAANLGKPFAWGGDYSRAASVSLAMDAERVEDGLHTLSGDSAARAVVAYGGSARAGDVPGGNLFIVDPGFLCYDAEPLEIAVTVRRNEANDNAGFKLVYEAATASGFKTAGGWYTIPDNRQWHTVRFRIDDPRFVNYWGYNFALVSDGNQYNRYLLKNVTVTKLKR